MGTAVAEEIDVEFDDPGEGVSAGAGALATMPMQNARPPTVVEGHGGGFLSLIEKAVVAGNIDLVDKMMGLQERWAKNESVKAFNNALASAKAEIKPIIKNRHVGFKSKNGGSDTSYNHEDIAGIADHIDGILGRHGLFYRWKPSNDFAAGTVTVKCIVAHRLGHSEETELSGKVDVSGNKNALQAVASAVTYLERYTLKAALGLASKHDDDGHAAGSPVRAPAPAARGEPDAEDAGELLSPKQIEELQDLIVNRGVNIAPFLAWVARSAPGVEKLGDIPAALFDSSVAAIKQKFPENK
jgi:hypothetical protein